VSDDTRPARDTECSGDQDRTAVRDEDMPQTTRCPYCVEGVGFKAMTGSPDGYRCARCNHVTVPDDPDYQCECVNCAKLARRQESPKKKPTA
jgi:hypothetical protein